MTISFGTPTTAVDSTGSATSITVTKPTGLVDGSHVIVVVGTRSTSTSGTVTSWTMPTGFTKVVHCDTTNTQTHYAAFIKAVPTAASEPANYTFTIVWSGAQVGDMSAFAVACLDAQGAGVTTASSGGTDADLVFNTLTPTGIGVYFACGAMNRAVTFTWNTGLTELSRVPTANATIGNRITTFGATKALSGASGTLTATASELRNHNEAGFVIEPFGAASPPTAVAGADQTTRAGELVTLDATGSSGVGGLSYQWLQISGAPVAILDSSTAGVVHYNSPFGATVATFQVTVTDNNGSATDTVSVTTEILDAGLPLKIQTGSAWT